MSAAGLDRDVLAALIQTRRPTEPTTPREQPVQPQAHRQAQRARLNEASRAIAVRICTAAGLSPVGKKIAIKLGAASDLAAVIRLMHAEVNQHLGIRTDARRELSVDELDRALKDLETIGDRVQESVLERLS